MKKIMLLSLVLAAFSFSYGQTTVAPVTTTTATPPDVLKLKESEHDFSQIPQGKPVYYTFEVVNTGTTPEWNKDPIAAGSIGKIRVGYNAAAEGYFEKVISITYNTNQNKQLKIKGTVWKSPEGAAPVNASVDFLKKQTL